MVWKILSLERIFLSLNNFLNPATGLLVAVAIAFIVVFVSVNINHGDVEMSKDKNLGTNIDKSANIQTKEKVSNTPYDWTKDSANIPTMEQVPSSTTTSQGGSSSESKK